MTTTFLSNLTMSVFLSRICQPKWWSSDVIHLLIFTLSGFLHLKLFLHHRRRPSSCGTITLGTRDHLFGIRFCILWIYNVINLPHTTIINFMWAKMLDSLSSHLKHLNFSLFNSFILMFRHHQFTTILVSSTMLCSLMISRTMFSRPQFNKSLMSLLLFIHFSLKSSLSSECL